jgi:hypothetical protein
MEYDIMETFTAPKKLVDNPHFQEKKEEGLAHLSDDMIDPPIIDIVNSFNQLPFCFTLQSCYGHFLYNDQKDPQNLNRLPVIKTITSIEYRIAYIAFCIENSVSGGKLLKRLEEITLIDLQNIQFCSAEWFWKRQVNSYALQVEPDRFKRKDSALLDYQEALIIEKIRDSFFARLKELL